MTASVEDERKEPKGAASVRLLVEAAVLLEAVTEQHRAGQMHLSLLYTGSEASLVSRGVLVSETPRTSP